jgi:hypothetical protein
MDQAPDRAGHCPAGDDDRTLPGGELEMKRKWNYFAVASALAALFLLSAGAPPLAVAAGIGFGALVTRRAVV